MGLRRAASLNITRRPRACLWLLRHCRKERQTPVQKLVPVEGIEPPTFGLQNRCSTAELNRHSS